MKCYVIKVCRKKFLLWEIELHYKQLSWTVHKQPSTVVYFRKFIQEIPVVESFFSSNYKLTVQSGDYILKWLYQECFVGNLRLGLSRSSCPQSSIFENLFRKNQWQSCSFGKITDWLFRVAIVYKNDSTKNVFLEIFDLDCSEAVVHGNPYSEIPPENTDDSALFW